ncbi:MAG TPA: hypothetical protein VND41_00605 [Nitrososphaerales archaeon]|nr:hypothetical protein [Nitrososphaerales archaeon]
MSAFVGKSCVCVNRRARKPPRYRTAYSVAVTGPRAPATSEILMPLLMGEKRDQAKPMLEEFSWIFARQNMARLPKRLAEFYAYLNEKRLNANVRNPASVPR